VKLLLDTHVVLWSLGDDGRLSERARSACLDPRNELLVSAASYWEICIKLSLGRLDLRPGWERILDRHMTANAMAWLPIAKEHCRLLPALPFHHRDPFDRLLVCQAQHERCTVVSADGDIAKYDVRVVW
jgi:PIN domain nuclease of toxin-antitoxin system